MSGKDNGPSAVPPKIVGARPIRGITYRLADHVRKPNRARNCQRCGNLTLGDLCRKCETELTIDKEVPTP